MRPSRETVFAALFQVLQNAYPWQTCSRTVKNIQDVQPESFPAAFQIQGTQAQHFKGAVPTVGDWNAQWILYAYSDDPDVASSTQLNAMVDAAIAALAPPEYGPDQKFSLGGLCEFCAVEGNVEIFEGVLGQRAIAIVPIRILIAGF